MINKKSSTNNVYFSAINHPIFGQTSNVFLSFWDTDSKNSFNIDLWNKEMTMEEMKFFIFQSLLKLSSILERSTGDENLVKKMKEFSKQFGKMADVLK